MEKYFKLTENGTDVKREVIGGITTFLTMAYIIAVNADILGTEGVGMPAGAIVTATCLTAGLTTIFMGLYANLPFALASGMGLNAFFAFSVVLGMKVPWQVALTAVFVEGIIFIVLSLTNVREMVVNAIPTNLKYAVTAGIGLFIAFIGFSNAGIVVSSEATKLAMGNLTSPTVIIATIGILLTVVLSKKNVKGAILWGILGSSIVAWIYAYISPEAASHMIFMPNGIFKYESLKPIAFKLDFSYLLDPSKIASFMTIVFTFLFVDFFDTVGTLVGVASKVGMVDEEGRVKNAGKALLVDAIGTTLGAVAGTSTVTTYVESSAGVAVGARTGLASVVTGILFLIALFFSPIFVSIPGCATAPALIIVGFYMIDSIRKIDFSDYTEGVPAFFTLALMPLTYSIGDGLTIGVISYAAINLLNNIFGKEKKKVSMVMYILAAIFIIKIIVASLAASH
ncbi:permease family protein [Clostridium argentinense CDC 2741]|uniref:Permease family protein n=1 Tax=Clostridium argentinense CDC 2741 TaxID=1418104 RepID=A0A0C1U484_9CLOT|nr:NCS2 family permease [Clostridium argentinense]ARC84658.1 NCS2 family permease [Clostridium argentinense]KIE47604.1 permease family protein [Clostridium argentinense CDC 2741]NFF40166.1 NCS2 family permease [Clostridium argentinense]NFP50631.1 NCS2 family permease [Clostridium argentinense]NFP72421.1 NCS2 family permease [Clostridium argentinense]